MNLSMVFRASSSLSYALFLIGFKRKNFFNIRALQRAVPVTPNHLYERFSFLLGLVLVGSEDSSFVLDNSLRHFWSY